MKRLIVVNVLLLTCVCGLFAQNKLQPLATVKINKSETITLAQLMARVEVYQRQSGGVSYSLEQKKAILDSMIDEKLLVQKATKDGITITDTQLNQYFLNTLASMVGKQVTEQEFAELVKTETGKTFDQFMKEQVGMTVAEYKSYLKNQMVAQQYIGSLKQKDMESITVSDDEVRQFYEINRSSFVQSDMLRMFLVVVPKNDDISGAKTRLTSLQSDFKAKKITTDGIKKQMEADNKKLQAGEMFVSKNSTAAAQLGLDYNQLLELFKKSNGFISEVTETESNFQFYTILEKFDAKMLSLSDLVQPGTTVTVYQYVKENLVQQKQSQMLQTALEETTKSLRVPANYKMEKTGTALDKLLTW